MRPSGPRLLLLTAFALLAGSGVCPAQLTIQILPGSGLSGNADALTAFNRAATMWTDRLTTAPGIGPVTVRIDANLAVLSNPNVIGSTGSNLFTRSYDEVRDRIAATAAGDPGKAILSSLPTAAQFTVALPAGRTYAGTITSTTANAKALGYTFAENQSDAAITFNSQFAFDYNRSDGITGVDFQTVAAHEIGHALGFISGVDRIDTTTDAVVPVSPLDLFRFNDAGPKPTTAAEFATTTRELRPGQEAVTSDTVNEYRMSTGVNNGDGRQASHWKDDQLLGTRIGIMDPSLSTNVAWDVSDADVRAFALIGYGVVPVPEPTAVFGFAVAGWAVVARVRRSGRAATAGRG